MQAVADSKGILIKTESNDTILTKNTFSYSKIVVIFGDIVKSTVVVFYGRFLCFTLVFQTKREK